METQAVYVFKTSAHTKKAIKSLSNQLNILLQDCQWNFDLEDCDKILRVKSSKNILETITKTLAANDYECVALF